MKNSPSGSGFQVDIFFSTYTPQPGTINGTAWLLETYRPVRHAFRNPTERDKRWTQGSIYKDVEALFSSHVKHSHASYEGLLMIRFEPRRIKNKAFYLTLLYIICLIVLIVIMIISQLRI